MRGRDGLLENVGKPFGDFAVAGHEPERGDVEIRKQSGRHERTVHRQVLGAAHRLPHRSRVRLPHLLPALVGENTAADTRNDDKEMIEFRH